MAGVGAMVGDFAGVGEGAAVDSPGVGAGESLDLSGLGAGETCGEAVEFELEFAVDPPMPVGIMTVLICSTDML